MCSFLSMHIHVQTTSIHNLQQHNMQQAQRSSQHQKQAETQKVEIASAYVKKNSDTWRQQTHV